MGTQTLEPALKKQLTENSNKTIPDFSATTNYIPIVDLVGEPMVQDFIWLVSSKLVTLPSIELWMLTFPDSVFRVSIAPLRGVLGNKNVECQGIMQNKNTYAGN